MSHNNCRICMELPHFVDNGYTIHDLARALQDKPDAVANHVGRFRPDLRWWASLAR